MIQKNKKIQIEEHIKHNIISLIDELIPALSQKNIDVVTIKKISSHIIHTLSVYQDKDSKHIAIITYSLYQILKLEEKERKEINIPKIVGILKEARRMLIENKINQFRKETKKIITEISRVGKKINKYMQDVVSKAELVKGASLYRHGISLEKAAQITGITQWELMDYAGKEKIPEEETKDVLGKVKYAKKIFNIK